MVCVVINGSNIPKEDELVKKLLALSFSNERKIASIMVNINREKQMLFSVKNAGCFTVLHILRTISAR